MEPAGLPFNENAFKPRLCEYLRENDRFNGKVSEHHTENKVKKTRGHYGAIEECYEKGWKHQRISTQDILKWNEMIKSESNSAGLLSKIVNKIKKFDDAEVKQINVLIETLLTKLSAVDSHRTDAKIIELMADFFASSSKLQFFKENEDVKKLLVNYIVSWFHQPVMIFRFEEKDRLEQAQEDPKKLKIFLVDKIREVAFAPYSGHVLEVDHSRSNLTTYKYKNSDGEGVAIEWHDLVHAMDEWEKKPDVKSRQT